MTSTMQLTIVLAVFALFPLPCCGAGFGIHQFHSLREPERFPRDDEDFALPAPFESQLDDTADIDSLDSEVVNFISEAPELHRAAPVARDSKYDDAGDDSTFLLSQAPTVRVSVPVVPLRHRPKIASIPSTAAAGATTTHPAAGKRQPQTAPQPKQQRAAPVRATPHRAGHSASAAAAAARAGAVNRQSLFTQGLHESKLAVGDSAEAEGWAVDAAGAGAPRLMLRAEELMALGGEGLSREKIAERAMRMYNHAKWFAERNQARAAEWRYREAARLGLESRRSAVAAHALSRLGYFLMHWGRHDEARQVLLESEKLNKKANPLGPFLFGVLERRAAGADVVRLLAAEERILEAGEQPSDELEVERHNIVEGIKFWRAAEASPRHCFEAPDVAHGVICLLGHACIALKQAFSSH